MLRDESRHDLIRRKPLGMFRKKALVAQMPPAAHHRKVYADQPILLRQRDDVGVCRPTGGLDELLLLDGMQGAQLVAQRGSLLVMLMFRRYFHRRAQRLLDLLMSTLQ